MVPPHPKVCTFHLHFFFAAGSSGAWRIDAHPGGGQVMEGTWDSGEAERPVPLTTEVTTA